MLSSGSIGKPGQAKALRQILAAMLFGLESQSELILGY